MRFRPRRHLLFWLAIYLFGMSMGSVASAQTLVVGGTGAALGFMRKLGEEASRADPSLKIQVLPSMGSTGGVRALNENVLSLGLVGRSLSPAEMAGGVSEAVCFLTPYVFVTSTAGVTDVTRPELISYYGGDRPTWRTGAPVRVLLRPISDVATPFLAELIPGMADALAHARTRREILIAATDQENVELAMSVADSLTGVALTQLIAESISLTRLSLDGVAPTVERMINGAYPRGLRFCVVQGRRSPESASRLVEWMRKPEREALYASLGVARQ